MSKYLYEGPSDFFIYDNTKLKANGTPEVLPDNVVDRYTKQGHFFKKVAESAAKATEAK